MLRIKDVNVVYNYGRCCINALFEFACFCWRGTLMLHIGALDPFTQTVAGYTHAVHYCTCRALGQGTVYIRTIQHVYKHNITNI
jgi:hypothetical protein